MDVDDAARARSKTKVSTKHISGRKYTKPVEHISLGELFFRQAEKYESHVCQVSALEDLTETYGSVKLRAIRLALELEKRGIGSKDIIAVCSDHSMDNMIPVIASMYIGAKVINLDHTNNPKHLKYSLNLVPPNIIFVEDATAGFVKDILKEMNIKPEVLLLGQQLKPYKDEQAFTPAKVDVHETAVMFFTGGISGSPKAVCHSHYSLLRVVHTVMDCGLVSKTVMHFTSFCWITMIIILVCCFNNGSVRIFARSASDGEQICTYVEMYKLHTIFMAPGQSYSLVNTTLNREYDLSSLKNLILCGSTVPLTFLKALMHVFEKANVIFNYGLSEVGIVTTFNPQTDEHLIHSKVGSCGKVVPETKIKVVQANREETVGPNVHGEIRVKSPGLMKGYHSLDCSEFFDAEGFLKTGDIGYYDEEGCFYVMDRVKEIFMYQQHSVVPSFIEAVLLDHPAVKEAGVFALPTRDEGDVPAACVVLKEGYYVSQKELEQYVAEKVTEGDRLRGGVKFVTTIPKTQMGRVLRRELKTLFLDQAKRSDTSIPEGML